MCRPVSGPRVNAVGDFRYSFIERVASAIERSGLDVAACYSVVWQYTETGLPEYYLDPAYNQMYPKTELQHVTYVRNTMLHSVMVFCDDTLTEHEIVAALSGALRIRGAIEWEELS